MCRWLRAVWTLGHFFGGAVGETAGSLLLACVTAGDPWDSGWHLCIQFLSRKVASRDDIRSWLSTQDSTCALIPSQGGGALQPRLEWAGLVSDHSHIMQLVP